VRTTACIWGALGFPINSMLAKQQTNVPVLLSLPMKYLTQTTYEGWQRPTGVIAARCSVPWHRKHTTYFTLSLLFLLWQPSWLCVPTKINSCTNRANKYNWSSLVWIHSVLKLVWSLLSTFWPHMNFFYLPIFALPLSTLWPHAAFLLMHSTFRFGWVTGALLAAVIS